MLPLDQMQTQQIQYYCYQMKSNYSIIRHIGSGSFGDVYEVKHTLTNITYAMKQIRFEANQKTIVQREIDILIKMKHPNILKLYQYFYQKSEQTNEMLCMILEYCRNFDLFGQISKNKKSINYITHQNDVVFYFRQIVQGCLALNEKGIIHRDLKPENILLAGKVVKIGDFGTAKSIARGKHRGMRNSYNIGTPLYSAPQILHENHYDNKCDVWSAGVILHVMIYGKLPFVESNTEKLKETIRQRTKYKLELPNFPEISESLKSLVRDMLQQNPALRSSWLEIIHNRIFHKKIEDIEKYIRYLIEINKIISWILQSLISSFQSFYNIADLCRLIQYCNLFMASNMQLIDKIMNKQKQVEMYFQSQILKTCGFSQDLLNTILKIKTKFEFYLNQMNKKLKTINYQHQNIPVDKKDRYYLWEGQQICRKLITRTYAFHQSSVAYKRSVFCLILISGFDRYLGEQHYLSLKSQEIIDLVKKCEQKEMDKRIIKQMQRIT